MKDIPVWLVMAIVAVRFVTVSLALLAIAALLMLFWNHVVCELWTAKIATYSTSLTATVTCGLIAGLSRFLTNDA